MSAHPIRTSFDDVAKYNWGLDGLGIPQLWTRVHEIIPLIAILLNSQKVTITVRERDQTEVRERERMGKMNFSCASKAASILILLVLATLVSAKKSGDVTELQIGVKYKPESCDIQAHKGDRIKVHYRGKLTDGTVFDSSFERGDPIEFELGSGQVIKGWDQGLLAMCVGEKRKLKIPAKLGYGAQGSPPTIPGGATLIFDTELVAVNGKTSSGGNTDDSEL